MTDQTAPQARIFKIGATRIVEDASTAHLNAEEIRSLLKTSYPEVAHATIRETTSDDGQMVLHFIAIPGRKG